MKRFRLRHGRLALFAALLTLSLTGGCARQPPSQNALSGVRLRVTLNFEGAIRSDYYYFFLINASNNQSADGPVPVFNPISNGTYGNGFATSSTPGKSGFTDFILFSRDQRYGGKALNGYGLYHVRQQVAGTDNGEANSTINFVATGAPLASTFPDPNNTNYNQLVFEIDMSQLITDASGSPLADANLAVSKARAIRFLQVNAVATNLLPVDVTTAAGKEVDSFGDNTLSLSGNFLQMDISQTGTVPTGPNDPAAFASLEPSYSDVVGGSDKSLNLVSWKIEVTRQ